MSDINSFNEARRKQSRQRMLQSHGDMCMNRLVGTMNEIMKKYMLEKLSGDEDGHVELYEQVKDSSVTHIQLSNNSITYDCYTLDRILVDGTVKVYMYLDDADDSNDIYTFYETFKEYVKSYYLNMDLFLKLEISCFSLEKKYDYSIQNKVTKFRTDNYSLFENKLRITFVAIEDNHHRVDDDTDCDIELYTGPKKIDKDLVETNGNKLDWYLINTETNQVKIFNKYREYKKNKLVTEHLRQEFIYTTPMRLIDVLKELEQEGFLEDVSKLR